MNSGFDRKLIVLFVIISMGALVLCIISYRSQKLHSETNRWVEHTQRVIYESEKIISYAKEFGNGNRGYLLAHDSAFIQNYFIAKDSIGPTLQRFKALTRDNPLQQTRIDSLAVLVNQRIQFSERIIQLTNENKVELAKELIVSRRGLGSMNSIRSLIFDIQKEENSLLVQRKNVNEESERIALVTFYLMIIGLLFILAFTLYIILKDIRYRRGVEQELHRRSELLSQTLKGLGDGVIATDANGIVTFLNKVATELTGWTQEEAVGTHIAHIFKITHERTGLTVSNPVMEAIQKNEVVLLSNHTILKRKDGGRLYIDDSGAPIQDLNGKVIGGVLVFRDISDKKKAEDEARASEEKFRAYFDNSMAGILFTAPDGRIINANPSACAILGMTEEEICRLGRAGIVDATDPQLSQFLELRAKAGRVRGEMTMVRKDGTKFPADVGSAVFDYRDGEKRTCLIFEDITERKKSEALIRQMNKELELRVEQKAKEIIEKEERYRHALDHMMEGVQIIDFNWRYVYLNEKALKQSTYTAEQLVGRTMMEMYPGIESTQLFETLEQCMKSRASAHLDNEFVFPNKTRLWFELSIQPVPEGLFILSTDITERKQIQNELMEHNIALKKANAELDRFVYSVSHDLRAPLTSLLGLIAIIQKEMDPAAKSQQGRLTMMKRSVNRLDSFIADILDYSRNARTNIASDKISFKEIINEVAEHVKYMVSDSDCDLSFKIEQQNEFVSDGRRIKVILHNLISNGIKYRDLQKKNSFVVVQVKTNAKETLIEVDDNGIGVAETDREKIFEMFKRVSIQGAGSGIGLYIVKETVEKLKGSIEVNSTINKGSTFRVRLPNKILFGLVVNEMVSLVAS